MPSSERSSRRSLTRADLPAELTPDTLRAVSFQTLRHFADHRNGVLDAEEQRQYDDALHDVMRATTSRIDAAVRRAPRGSSVSGDPSLSRSYERAQQRLAEQARRARERFPELALDHSSGPAAGSENPEPSDTSASDGSTTATSTTAGATADDATADDVSPSTLEQEVEQTSDTLDLLERIATLQQQQLEHQEAQLLTETRGVFFAFLVSVAVIIAGIAPLIEAEPHERLLIVVWTVAVTAVAGLVYALVRRIQGPR